MNGWDRSRTFLRPDGIVQIMPHRKPPDEVHEKPFTSEEDYIREYCKPVMVWCPDVGWVPIEHYPCGTPHKPRKKRSPKNGNS